MKTYLIYVLVYILNLILPTHGYGYGHGYILLQSETIEENTESNITDSKKNTIVSKVEDLVKQEFAVDLKNEDENKEFNKTLAEEEGLIETVVLVTKKKKETNTTLSSNSTLLNSDVNTDPNAKDNFKRKDTFDVDVDVDRIIDSHDNEFVLSRPKKVSGLSLDPLFIQDLTIIITSSASMGALFEIFHQPVINGYFIAGAIIGPGGLKLIKEVVQVESMAQLGVQLLLFDLGLKFSIKEMKVVGLVAIFGGLLEMLLFVIIAIGISLIMDVSISVGIFVGCLISLSSTSVVLKCLESSQIYHFYPSQITISTLILQDCTVGLIFAIMPLLCNQEVNLGFFSDNIFGPPVLIMVASLILKLLILAAVTSAIAFYLLPQIIRLTYETLSQEISQVGLIAFCFVCSWTVNKIGLSYELGAFLAGLMISITPQAEIATKSIESIRNLFITLFIASIGLIMSPVFLWDHLKFLALSTMALFITKIVVISSIVKLFRHDNNTSLLVGFCLCQVSEFAFVLLSMGRNLEIIKGELYLLLLGVTALSLLMTPGIITIAKNLFFKSQYYKEIDIEEVTSPLEIVKKEDMSVTSVGKRHSSQCGNDR